MQEQLSNFYLNSLKPFFDLLFAVIFLVVLSPVFLFLFCLLGFNLKRYPVFYQARIGKNNEPFHLIKFRTLKVDHDLDSTTWFSRFIRSLSFDELPQLLNIVRMEMSFVGPRPLLPEYLDSYNTEEIQRHLLMPGLTGLAQLKMGNSSKWSERMKLDIQYVRTVSFWLDVKILLSTALHLLNFNRKSAMDTEIIRFDDYAKKR